MSRDAARELSAAVVRDIARTLAAATPARILTDQRLGSADVAAEVTASAGYHGLVPLLWAAIEHADVPAALRSAVHDAYLPLVARALRLQHLLTVVDTALRDADVAYAVYKGPAAARYYPEPELRSFGDIDMLVHRPDLERVDDALRAAGLQGGWQGVPEGYAETDYQLPGFGTLDLHWHVMREPAVRAAYRLDTDVMLARARRVACPAGSVPVLDPVDELIAVATHACFDGAYRLGWLVDVGRLLLSGELNYGELARRCVASGTALPVQVVIDRATRTLALPGRPPLARGMWRAILTGVSAARPVERTFRQAGRGGLLFRATRPTSGRSVVALAGLANREALRPLLTDPNHRWRIGRKRRF
jgi:hypothetical protein